MKLKAITYCYFQDGTTHSKVVGLFTDKQLQGAMEKIRETFGKDKSEQKFECNHITNNYFLNYSDEERSYFYSGDYTVGELNL